MTSPQRSPNSSFFNLTSRSSGEKNNNGNHSNNAPLIHRVNDRHGEGMNSVKSLSPEQVREGESNNWMEDGDATHCPLCNVAFTLFKRKHHCRRCGGIFCNKCSTSRHFIHMQPARICDSCVVQLNGKEENGSVEVSREYGGGDMSLNWSFEKLGEGNIRTWFEMIHKNHSDANFSDIHSETALMLNKRLFNGISNGLRPVLWPQLAESSELQKKNAGVYEEILKMMPAKCKYMDQINADVPRTFPSHDFFRNQDGQRQLRNILMAFTTLKGDIGYCQGLNYLAGVMLIHMDEESALWMLMQLMKKYDFEGFYIEGTPSLDIYMKKFEDTLPSLLPDLFEHFEKTMFPIQIFVSQWLKTIFAYNFPLDLVFRIWDVFLAEKIDFLLWVVFMILDNNQAALLRMSETDMMSFFNKLPDYAFDSLRMSLRKQT
eukprot:TRINITY_DN3739_c0_g1_i1.p2 TRINITY_DN3739_c0_g1~~TRINITY_DN3739_c0_g1_i1.p2  ORF type:complete len:431 (+),score=119.20 TRINITY_DN3739_c0_g1_i1:418-1710(+)